MKQVLNNHVSVIHEGKRPFKCLKCSKSYGKKDNLIFHVKKVHNATKEMIFEIRYEWPVTCSLGDENNLSGVANFPCKIQPLDND